MRIVTRTSALLAAFALALVAGCAADPGSGADDFGDTGGRPDPDTGLDAGMDTGGGGGQDTGGGGSDTPIPGEPRLEFVSDQNIRLSFNASEEMQVRYVDGNENPIADARIEFSYDEVRANGSALRALTARTGDDGIAGVTLVAGGVPADFEVTASIRGDDSVSPITFFVRVTAKEAADYVFQVHYGDDRPLSLQNVDIFLFQGDASCDDIPRNPDEIVGAIDQVTVFPLADGSFDGYGYEALPEDIPITYAVAVAYMEDTAVGFACNDGPFELGDGGDINPEDVEIGQNVIVDLFVTELFPSIQGEYQVEMEFDLIEFLPGTVQDVVRYIGSFFDSPGGTIFDILEDADVFDAEDLPFGIGDAIAEAIDALLFAFLPPEAISVFESGTDIYDALQNIRMQGRIVVFEDVNEFGELAECNEIVLDKLIVNFDTLDDGIFDLRARGYQAAYGNFSGWMSVSVDGGVAYQLNIDPFSLDINYGELAVFILEQVVFPLVLGPEVDSMEDFVRSFIDCEAIAVEVGWDPIEDLCDTIIDAAVAGLIDFLADQSVDTGSFYVLQTPAEGSTAPDDVEILEEGMRWGPCDLRLNTDGGAFEVDQMGGPGRDRCVWDARFREGEADPVGRPVSAAFQGVRRSNRVTGACGDGE